MVTRLDNIHGPVNLGRFADYLLEEMIVAKRPKHKHHIHIPVNSEGHPGIVSITAYHIDSTGRAGFTVTPGVAPPEIGITGAPESLPVISVEAAYSYNFRELERAELSGIRVDSQKALIAGDAVEEQINKLAYLGAPDYSLYGLFSPTIPRIASSVNFNDPVLTVDEASNKLTDWATTVYNTLTNTAFQVDTVVMPPIMYTYMLKRRRSDHDSTTLMQAFRESNPFITMVDETPWASVAGPNGTPAMIFYTRDPSHLELHIPGGKLQQKIISQSEVNTSWLVFKDTAGVRIKQPSALIVEGFWH